MALSNFLSGPAVAFSHRDFRRYQAARMTSVIGTQMQGVAVGWHVYSITREPISLGYVGLAQFLPAIVLWLVTGQVADRFDRRRVLALCHMVLLACGLGLCALSLTGSTSTGPIYAILVVVGAARAFAGPAAQSLAPNLVPKAHLPNAIAWSSSMFQVSTVSGPALGGLLFAGTNAATVYAAQALLECVSVVFLLAIATRSRGEARTRSPAELVAGLRYVWREKLLLGAISLDLFAVLLGGAIALLPVFARDILHTGPTGLGLLRSAPAAGAAVVAVLLAYRPINHRAGRTMFAGVLAFGLATIVFGLSKSFALSLVALVLTGAADMLSVFVRSSMVQLNTPDAMRGRVAAVNLVFIGASNELGEFESGLTAAWLGTVPAVVLGGTGTILVVLIWAVLFPELRRADRLEREPAQELVPVQSDEKREKPDPSAG
ncbi:MAG TPA: MFS transporter [Polyangiaceae bacterium]|nr:MFS transporter [Polyangiaceae bacterium]